MLTFIFIIIIVICLLLTLLVLIQNPKGGIAANFVAPSQIMGVKKSTDVVEKATWVLAIALISLSLLSNFFRPDGASSESLNESRLKDAVPEVTAPAPTQQQQQPADQNAQPADANAQPAGTNK